MRSNDKEEGSPAHGCLSGSPSMACSARSSVDVMETLWPAIEVFADLESTTSMAQTCVALHGVIVDEETRRIKVSHFEVDGYSPSMSSAFSSAAISAPFVGVKNWTTAPARIPHFVPRALNAIHFPSLSRVSLGFPRTKRRRFDGRPGLVEDAHTACFPLFVSNLAYAHNLESLSLDASRFIMAERGGHLEALLELFGHNLARCRKLRDLSVHNEGVVQGCAHARRFSVALTTALLPALRRRPSLRLFKVMLGGLPSDPDYDHGLRLGHSAALNLRLMSEFFTQLLLSAAAHLHVLDLTISDSFSHLASLMHAAHALLHPRDHTPTQLTQLRLSFMGDSQFSTSTPSDSFTHQPSSSSFDPTHCPASPFLEYFSSCQNIQTIFLELPKQCWEGPENADALKLLLRHKIHLTSLVISFSCYHDSNGRIFQIISDSFNEEPLDHCATNVVVVHTSSEQVATGRKTNLNKFSIFGLMCVNNEKLKQTKRCLEQTGLVPLKNLERKTEGYSGRMDVMILDYQRL